MIYLISTYNTCLFDGLLDCHFPRLGDSLRGEVFAVTKESMRMELVEASCNSTATWHSGNSNIFFIFPKDHWTLKGLAILRTLTLLHRFKPFHWTVQDP